MWSARVCYVYRSFLDFSSPLFIRFPFLVFSEMFTDATVALTLLPAVVSVSVPLSSLCLLFLPLSVSLTPFFTCLRLVVGWCGLFWSACRPSRCTENLISRLHANMKYTRSYGARDNRSYVYRIEGMKETTRSKSAGCWIVYDSHCRFVLSSRKCVTSGRDSRRRSRFFRFARSTSCGRVSMDRLWDFTPLEIAREGFGQVYTASLVVQAIVNESCQCDCASKFRDTKKLLCF